jgi:nicotinamide mononucleotide transporter
MGWLALILSALGIILNARKHIWCWPIWIFSNMLWVIYFGPRGDLAPSALNIGFALANVYGWWCWYPRKKAGNLEDPCI